MRAALPRTVAALSAGLRHAVLAAAAALTCLALPAMAQDQPVRPKPRPVGLVVIPTAQWDFRSEGDRWTRDALAALKDHGGPLVRTVPQDAGDWCPGYKNGTDAERRAFWVAFLSALAKHESRWRPGAVGGGGRWYGLLQILPATARSYNCAARTGDALKDGSANLSCAIRIMARTVPRDGVIHAQYPRWSGVSADWGPMRSDAKRAEMANWLRGQEFCQIKVSPRPKARPMPQGLIDGPYQPEVRPMLRPAPVPATVVSTSNAQVRPD